MIKALRGVGKIKELMKIGKLQLFLILLFSLVIYASLGLEDRQATVYKATIGPAENSTGPVKVVFYGDRYKDYRTSGALNIPEWGWSVNTLDDCVTLTAVNNAPPLIIRAVDEPVVMGLWHYSNQGVVRLVDSNNIAKLISLKSNTESVSALTIGGYSSDVPQSGTTIQHVSVLMRVGAFILILVILTLIARIQLRKGIEKSIEDSVNGYREIVYFALPLFASTSIVLLCYWPGNAAFDASLQWYQAAARGTLSAPLGITATLFMRLFTYISVSPALVILFQSSLSAVGIALILRELRYRGLSRWAAQIFTLVLAILPQYPTFFTNLGKDALGALGIIFFAWSLLSISRNTTVGKMNYFSLVVSIAAAVFAGVMRINLMLPVAFIVLVLGLFLAFRGRRAVAFAFVILFFIGAIFIPRISFSLSDEQRLSKVGTAKNPGDQTMPLGWAANLYIYHLFSAAVHSGAPLRSSDAELFYRIAPRSAWAKYDCSMTDPTFISVSNALLLKGHEYSMFLTQHQRDLASAVSRIVKDNPAILLDRQVCVTRMLWYVGYEQKPFQTTATLGYDSVVPEFKSIAGRNKTVLLPRKIKRSIQKYITWSETRQYFWLFWKPALIFYLSLFCVLLRLTIQPDRGLLLILLLSTSLTFTMALVIPFPAYRYQYPAALLMLIQCMVTFAGAGNVKHSKKICD